MNYIRTLIIASITLFVYLPKLQSQEALNIVTTAVPLLSVSPSPMQNGMGRTGVALISDDPFNTFFNPAQLGFAARTMNVRQGTYLQRTPWSPEFFSSAGINLNAYAIQFGYNLSEQIDLPLSVGVGYSRQFVDLGESSFLDERGILIDKFRSNESSNSVTVGASLNLPIQVAAGISLKRLTSNISSYVGRYSEATGTAIDIGVMALAPLLQKQHLTNKFYSSLNLSLGYSQSNIGDEISFVKSNTNDPLPRTSRLGYGISGSIDYELGESEVKILSGAFTAEVSDLLVEYKVSQMGVISGGDTLFTFSPEYQLWGDVNVWNNLVRGRAGNGDVSYQHGWRINFFETLTLMGGVFRQPSYNATPVSSTSGFVIQTRGIFKLLKPLFKDTFANFLFENIEVQYVRSSWNEGFYKNMTFESVNISLIGIRF